MVIGACGGGVRACPSGYDLDTAGNTRTENMAERQEPQDNEEPAPLKDSDAERVSDAEQPDDSGPGAGEQADSDADAAQP